jgi:hypothetical protein
MSRFPHSVSQAAKESRKSSKHADGSPAGSFQIGKPGASRPRVREPGSVTVSFGQNVFDWRRRSRALVWSGQLDSNQVQTIEIVKAGSDNPLRRPDDTRANRGWGSNKAVRTQPGEPTPLWPFDLSLLFPLSVKPWLRFDSWCFCFVHRRYREPHLIGGLGVPDNLSQ